ncbi:uncharacterized protein LOC121872286 [Homarus americanus]|uniref:UPAR/Ly6 domain-containing protein n=1 Tax=Homarus americanus TaxID=6706 RepID=A0A8J5MTZ7_HOMAM|nr:uncharacterized protein LOC121872286 [Homarus americanus]KAG7163973.1 hypothetical protein Hamer_G014430 [Homarus americanus]
MRAVLVTFGLAVLVSMAQGLSCYTCFSTNDDLECLNDPKDVTECQISESSCCSIYRQEFAEDQGQIISFTRGCQEECPKDGFFDYSDSTFKIYVTYCSSENCNTGPGNKPL